MRGPWVYDQQRHMVIPMFNSDFACNDHVALTWTRQLD